MTDDNLPSTDNDGGDDLSRRPRGVAVFIVTALLAITFVIGTDKRTAPPPENHEESLPVEITPTAPSPVATDNSTIDPAAIRVWQKAATDRQIDLSLYNVVYVQDEHSYTILLTAKDNTDLFAPSTVYEIIMERGSNRITAFSQRQ